MTTQENKEDLGMIMRIADGKIVEHWGEGDFLGMMQQLGAIPQPVQVRA